MFFTNFKCVGIKCNRLTTNLMSMAGDGVAQVEKREDDKFVKVFLTFFLVFYCMVDLMFPLAGISV